MSTPRSLDASPTILLETDVDPNPFRQFQLWFDDALRARLAQPEAMTLATATAQGVPSARTVLLRQFDERGFAFFTNYESRKARQLTANPSVALVLFWEALQRQVLVEGRVEKTSAAESDAYFNSRPRGSRIGAWASPQSQVLSCREDLANRVQAMEERFAEQLNPPRPPFWGGFRVVPHSIEFWQGQDSRLHDRICYRRQTNGSWVIERLAP